MTEYVLWCVDDATRMIRGEVVKDKKPETILGALERAWIIGRGAGPGLPEKYFFSDNGGEFVNEAMTNYLQQAGIRLKTTGSFSPQQNGVNERNHSSADILVTKGFPSRNFPNRLDFSCKISSDLNKSSGHPNKSVVYFIHFVSSASPIF